MRIASLKEGSNQDRTTKWSPCRSTELLLEAFKYIEKAAIVELSIKSEHSAFLAFSVIISAKWMNAEKGLRVKSVCRDQANRGPKEFICG